MMQTVLEKCGITNTVVSNLLKRGLFVPTKVNPVKNPIKSPSEEWFYQAADRFTPPLTKREQLLYMQNPEKFCEDLIKGVMLLAKICTHLYAGVNHTQKLSNKESIAALLVIQRLLHATLDYNYLKYDRHFEYHEYKQSPVGYYWQRLKTISLLAVKNAKVPNPKDFAMQKILELMSGFGVVTKSSRSKKIASNAYTFIANNLANKKHVKEFKRLIKIFRLFSTTQEKEVIIFNGVSPEGKGLIETLLHYWSFLKTRVGKGPQLITPTYQNKLNKWFIAKEVPEIITAAREFVQVDALPFAEQVQSFYNTELNRWIKH